MKKLFMMILSTCLVFVMGCSGTADQAETGSDNVSKSEEFSETEPSEWVVYKDILTEYFHYRTRSVIESDIEILYERYPSLSKNISIEEGINIEESELTSYNQGLNLIDANFDLEHYDRLKVRKKSENEAVLLVHGISLYMTEDFGESGGEFLMEVNLEKDGGDWQIIKTDEYTLPEYKAWMEKNRK